jgi:hypothetical protein
MKVRRRRNKKEGIGIRKWRAAVRRRIIEEKKDGEEEQDERNMKKHE